MSNNRNLHFKQQLLDEIWDELKSLKGKELDEYLTSLGMDPGNLLVDYEKALNITYAAPRRALFEEARRHIRQRNSIDKCKVLSFDLSRKKAIMTAIRNHATKTNEMTIAARNQRIEDEGDLDSFLEACVRLGLIDEEGNLKE